MIDLGKPFSEAYQDVIDALEDRVRNGVEQPARTRFLFEGITRPYDLPDTAYAITRVTGLTNRQIQIFEPGVDFRFANNRIIWLDSGTKPDQGSRFEVEYTYRERPTGLTDFNPGSVVGTLIRAVARQMKLIYDQMDEAYRRAFIDEATGVALDNVVALLGVVRNPALSATGEATFFTGRATDDTVTIPPGTRVADEFGRTFLTPVEDEIRRTIPPGTEELATASHERVVRVTNRIAELTGVWPRESEPDPETKLDTDAGFGDDERTITLASTVPPQGQVRVQYRPKSVTVPIQALQPGPEGNVNPGTITVMPTPPPRVAGVVNEKPTTGGQPPESDDQLRERAKHELERQGNATLDAIKFSVLDVDGVEEVEVIDRSVDDAVRPGEVRVRYSGGEAAEVESAIEEARAAGILVRPERIQTVLISGTFYLIPQPAAMDGAAESFRIAAVDAIRALTIGAPLSVRRLSALAYNVPGLAEVAEAQLYHNRQEGDGEENQDHEVATDPFVARPTELLRPDVPDLTAVLVGALRASRPPGNEPNELDVQLVDTGGNLIRWKNFAIDLAVTLHARLRIAPTQPPERIGTLTMLVSFANTDTAKLTITSADVDALDPGLTDEHLREDAEVTISASAYPGILGTEVVTVDLPDGT